MAPFHLKHLPDQNISFGSGTFSLPLVYLFCVVFSFKCGNVECDATEFCQRDDIAVRRDGRKSKGNPYESPSL